jgi:hypothetical protein
LLQADNPLDKFGQKKDKVAAPGGGHQIRQFMPDTERSDHIPCCFGNASHGSKPGRAEGHLRAKGKSR